MLVLSRRVGEVIVIGDVIRVMVMTIQGEKVRLGFSAPTEIRVDRAEVHGKRTEASAGFVASPA